MIAARQGIIAKQNNYVDITLYSSQGLYTGLDGYEVFYSTALCSGWNVFPPETGCPNSDTCAEYGSINILSNTTIYVTVKECADAGTFIKFNAANNTNTCPANEGNYCYDYEECVGTVFSFNSGNVKAKNIAIKVYVISSGKSYSYVVC